LSGLGSSAHLINAAQLQTIRRMAFQQCLRTLEFARKTGASQQWNHLLRCIMFVVKLSRPRKKHTLMDMVKDFLLQARHGMQIRMAMLRYTKTIKYLQNMFKMSYDLTQIVRKRVLLPQIWAVEALVIAESLGIKQDMIRGEVTKFLESEDLELWRQTAHELALARHQWSFTSVLPSRMSFTSALPSRMRRDENGMLKLMKSEEEAALVNMCDPEQKLAAAAQPLSAKNIAKRGQARRQQKKAHLEPERREIAGDEPAQLLKQIEPFRLTQEEREQVALQIWRESMLRWWHEFKTYKAACLAFRTAWRKWKLEVAAIGTDHRGLWPDEPECPKYPEQLLQEHQGAIKFHVIRILKQHRAAAKV
jgi:hypothetical protein